MDEKSMPKVLAVYLPQFYETEDNNRWWGMGFTDWESVKRADRCFEGHNVPWVPLNENYYDLSKIESLKWQADIAKRYGVDGFCFYHYYFKNGKKELEKPAELLLEHPEIDVPFCFNWASESWIRSWSKMGGNVWSEKFEGSDKEKDSGILVEQDYGCVSDWKEHFEYLLPFFKDKRYICIDGKPVFIFYRPGDIKCLKGMVTVWRKLAEKAGLENLYLIGVNVNGTLHDLDASLIYEPRTAINKMNESGKAINRNGVRCFEYQDAWDAVLQDKAYEGSKTFFTGISGYDDTPRRGKSGECLINNSSELFQNNFEKLLIKTIQYENEFVLINAWNEWGEGMYLEPDEGHRYEYLKAIKKAKENVLSLSEDILISRREKKCNEIDEEKVSLLHDVNKYKTFIEYYDKWLHLERKGVFKINEYLLQRGIHTVAIYGLGMLGKQLYEQLTDTNIKAEYGIDRYVGQYGNKFEIYRPEEKYWPEVDAIVITAYDEDAVEQLVSNKSKAKIVKLSEVIEAMWRQQ